jgi:hypothetical protein
MAPSDLFIYIFREYLIQIIMTSLITI